MYSGPDDLAVFGTQNLSLDVAIAPLYPSYASSCHGASKAAPCPHIAESNTLASRFAGISLDSPFSDIVLGDLSLRKSFPRPDA